MEELMIATDFEQGLIDHELKINEIVQWINKMEESKRKIVKALEMLGLVIREEE